MILQTCRKEEKYVLQNADWHFMTDEIQTKNRLIGCGRLRAADGGQNPGGSTRLDVEKEEQRRYRSARLMLARLPAI